MLARREDGEQRAVCEFVKPLRAGRLLNTPREVRAGSTLTHPSAAVSTSARSGVVPPYVTGWGALGKIHLHT